jgi:hypothetical protein
MWAVIKSWIVTKKSFRIDEIRGRKNYIHISITAGLL